MRCNNIIEAVGHTPLIRLNRMAQGLKPQIWIKAEMLNPGGSVKDRIGITMIDDAEKKGLLKPGGTIIEGTSGNTGMGLALVAAVRGYKCVFTTTDKQSKEKVDLLKALGAEVIVCPTAVDPEDPRSYYSVAKKLAREIPNSFYPNQYDNPTNPEAHYQTTGPEIWEDTEGKITHFVCGMGTGGTISGVGKFLKERNPKVKIIGVDPEGSLYYDFHKTGKIAKARTYVVEGIGEDFFPTTMDMKILDDVIQVNDEECFVVARRLAKLDGLFTGGSGGRMPFRCPTARQRPGAERLHRGAAARHRHALSEQGVQRRVDARTRLCGIDCAHHCLGSGKRQKTVRQGPRPGDCQAVPDCVSCAEDHAGARHLTDSRVRRKCAHRHRVRRSDSDAGTSGQRPAQIGGARSDEQASTFDPQERQSRARNLYSESRKSRRICGHGRGQI
jgi:cystathionine beta-synthase